ncbi:MAG: hypothetical protein EOO99_11500 [Pedobacter sp.]|nr:MAG: hypothetical protein EOO99_11500 [Pedobacter sp.]
MHLPLIFTISAFHAYAKPLNAYLLQQETSNSSQHSFFSTNDNKAKSGTSLKSAYTLKRVGAGKNNVVQGIAIDHKAKYLYTINVIGTPSKGVINRYRYDQTETKTAIDAQEPSDYIGHQGVTVEPQSSKLWASAGSIVKNHGWYAVRFNYHANAQPKNMQEVKLFGKGYSKGTNSMPTFSPDGKYLVARSAIKKDGQSYNVIRVFDLNKINLDSQKDLSNNYLYEWNVNLDLTPKNFPFQGMATDGKYVYMISGYGTANNNKLQVYTLQGELVQKLQNVTVGKEQALELRSDNHWEPEGLAIANNPTMNLYMIFATGEKGRRKAFVYSVNINE